MSTNSDGLVDHLLFKIALTGSQGLSALHFAGIVQAFHDSGHDDKNVNPESDDDIFLSATPPTQALIIDSQYLETIWHWTSEHAEISVRDSDEPVIEGAVSVPVTAGDRSTFFATHPKSRLYTTEDRIWHALTDHGVDWKRIPRSEFQVLSVIAAHGPEGILQPDVVKITGQDKRSVPKRTDQLHQKGYIIKESCIGGGTKTSLLRLKKFLKDSDTGAFVQLSSNGGDSKPSVNVTRYDQWYDDLLRILKENNGLMVFADIRLRLGIHGNAQQTRQLHRCVRRLVNCGLLKKLKARSDDEDPQSRKIKKSDQWLRCLQMLRDPIESDRFAFISSTRREQRQSTAGRVYWSKDGDGDEDADADADDLDSDADADDMTMLEMPDQINGLGTERPVPQWVPDLHYANLAFDVIEASGVKGASSMELGDLTMSRFYKRPFDETLGKLTDVWHISQPPHLRHLAVVRDTSVQGTVFHYVFRSLLNYQQAVEAGDASWEYVLTRKDILDAVNTLPELDGWGFPKISPGDFFGHDGSASVMNCSGNSAPSAKHARYSEHSKKKTKPVKQEPVDISDVISTPNKSRSKKPSLTKAVTPASEVVPKVVPPASISAKRQEKEISEWQQRVRKFAERHVREEMLKEGVPTPENSGLVPIAERPVKRLRGRPSEITQTLDNNATSEVPEFMIGSGPVDETSRVLEIDDTVTANATAAATTQAVEGDTDVVSMGIADQPSTTTDRKRKRQDNPTQAPWSPMEGRIRVVYENMLSMPEPGVYINPPGSSLKKIMYCLSIGRPRNNLIAVFKSSKLADFPWFTIDTTPERNPSARTPTSRQGTSRAIDRATKTQHSVTFDEEVLHAASSREPDDREPLQISSLKILNDHLKHVQSQVRETPVEAHGSRPKDSLDLATTSQKHIRAAMEGTMRSHALPWHSETTNTAVIKSNKSTEDSNPAEDFETSRDDTTMEVDTGNISMEVDAENTSMEDIAGNTSTEITPDNTLEKVSISENPADPSKPTQIDPDIDVAGRSTDATTPVPETRSTGYSNLWSMLKQRPSDRTLSGTRTPTPKKVGVQRNAGILIHQRTKIVLEIVRQCGGVFPGDNEIFFPFTSVWIRHFGTKPDRKTTERMLHGILAAKKLKRITFTFSDANGVVVKKHIIMEPHISSESQAVKDLQRSIAAEFPAPYVPKQAPMHPVMNQRIANHPANLHRSERKASSANYQDLFPEDETRTVKRSTAIVELGSTEEQIRASAARRQKKREDNERALLRYRDAQNEDEVEEAVQELQSAFRLGSYAHDPKVARVDRGPKGRARISKLVKLGSDKDKPKSTPLGSLRSIRELRAAKSDSTIIDAGFRRLVQGGDIKFSLMAPRQKLHSASGTFGTYPAIEIDHVQIPVDMSLNALEQVLPKSINDIMDLMEGKSHRRQFKPEYEDEYSIAFEYELYVVEEWEKTLARDRTLDGLFCDPVRLIIHNAFRPGSSFHDASNDVPQQYHVTPYPEKYRIFHFINEKYPFTATMPPPGAPPTKMLRLDADSAHVVQQMDPRFGAADVFQAQQWYRPGIQALRPIHPTQQPLQGILIPSTMNMPSTLHGPKAIKKPVKQRQMRRPFFRKPRQPRTRMQLPPPLSSDQKFLIGPQDDKRLILGVAIVGTLTGGLDTNARTVNWGLVHQVFRYKFEAKDCRQRWASIKSKHAAVREKLQQQFRKLFIEAYERDEIPEIDMAYPSNVDWAELVDWTEANLDNDDAIIDLPETREEFDEDYELEVPDEIYEPDKDEFYSNAITLQRRDEIANTFNLAVSYKTTSLPDHLVFAKSWVRASILTPDSNFDDNAVYKKLTSLTGPVLSRATEELVGHKIIRAENKGRTLPGRHNYSVTDATWSALQRTWEVARFKETASIKAQLDVEFSKNGRYEANYHGSDADAMVAEILTAYGRVVMTPRLPKVNNDINAPFPKLSKWGFTEGNYKTVHMDRERLHFDIELHPTDTYINGNPLREVAIPLTQHVPGEPGPRLPFWTDITGRLIIDNWQMVLVSILNLVATRPAITVDGIAKAHKNKIWTWEITMLLEWAETSGVLTKLDTGEDVGWTTDEWWWMALADHAADSNAMELK